MLAKLMQVYTDSQPFLLDWGGMEKSHTIPTERTETQSNVGVWKFLFMICYRITKHRKRFVICTIKIQSMVYEIFALLAIFIFPRATYEKWHKLMSRGLHQIGEEANNFASHNIRVQGSTQQKLNKLMFVGSRLVLLFGSCWSVHISNTGCYRWEASQKDRLSFTTWRAV